MELEFDKEMDALLRQSATRGVLVGDTLKLHLDADAISAFAENALPQKSREIYTRHLAECDPCRKTLSNLILMSAEAEPEMAAAVAPFAAASIPWYRRLFSTPNLAYTFGGLILLFGGLIGFIGYRSLNSSDAAISQVQDTQSSRSAAPFSAEPLSANANSNMAANSANGASNVPGEIPRALGSDLASTDADGGQTSPPPPPPVVASNTPQSGIATAAPAKPATVESGNLAAAQPAPKELEKLDEARARAEDKGVSNEADRKQIAEEQAVREQQLNQNMPGAGNTKDSGPSRSAVQRDNRAFDDSTSMRAKKVQEAPSGSGTGRASSMRTAGGKKFEEKQGAWYDTAYRGQATINVRRATEEYRKLDSGLRSIADSIGGTVVVVWKEKAYRIQ